MSAHGGQDWFGFIVVVLGVGGLAYLAYLDSRAAARRAERRAQLVADAIDAGAVELTIVEPTVDHHACVHDDCSTVLCFCQSLHPVTGQPMTCPGAQPPACDHSMVSAATPGGHCLVHQRSCPDCRIADHAVWGAAR